MPTTAEAVRRTTSRAGGSAAPCRFRTRVGRALRVGEHALAALGALLLIYHLFFELSVMVSPSMSPTLQGTGPQNGDWVLMERASYLLRSPRRWEVVAFHNNYGTPVMKRVVGQPGEDVSLADGEILINGAVTQRPASLAGLKYYAFGTLSRGRAAACGDGYFVLGDDSKDSEDSRYEGAVAPGRIRGRAWLVVWPLSRFGFVNP